MKKAKIYYNTNIKRALKKSVEMNLPALLIGETGTGKTSFIYDLANSMGKSSVIRINLTGQTGVDELIGKYLADEKGTYWVDGLLTMAMKKGKWVVLDEINMALPEILSKLHSLLDDDRKIILNEKEGEEIVPHKNFRFFATMNPDEEYAGTKELNKAFLSRFNLVINVNYSPKEVEILQDRTGIDADLAIKLVTVAREIRKNKKDEKLSYMCSTRDLIDCATLIKSGLKKDQAIEYAMVNKAPMDERVAIGKLIGLITGDSIEISEELSYKSVEDMIKDTKEREEIRIQLIKRKESMEKEIDYMKEDYSNIKRSFDKAFKEKNELKLEIIEKDRLISKHEARSGKIKVSTTAKVFPLKVGDKVRIRGKSIGQGDWQDDYMFNWTDEYYYGYVDEINGNPFTKSDKENNIIVRRTKYGDSGREASLSKNITIGATGVFAAKDLELIISPSISPSVSP